MRVSARTDYAVRVLIELAAADSRPVTCEAVAESQQIPYRFLKSVVRDLRLAGLVRSQRGCEGGYWIGRDAASITLADVVRAVDSELLTVNDVPPADVAYPAPASGLGLFWLALGARIEDVFGAVSIADLLDQTAHAALGAVALSS
ncbi:Rrf2 family protein [Catenulispora sp. GP43]|uniref:RrF2 family transcriptional regulator n=1 Tax=Catenulispora sp. GP43 TaxID=3156263 RepID=UPI003515F952